MTIKQLVIMCWCSAMQKNAIIAAAAALERWPLSRDLPAALNGPDEAIVGAGQYPPYPHPQACSICRTQAARHTLGSLLVQRRVHVYRGHHNIELQCSTVPASMFVHTKPLPLCAQKPDAWFYSALENHTNRGGKKMNQCSVLTLTGPAWWRPKQMNYENCKNLIMFFLQDCQRSFPMQEKDWSSFCDEVRS